jgi:integrase
MGRHKQSLPWRHDRWPEPDQSAWIAINAPGDAFDPPGRAATWAPRGRDNVEYAYGSYLNFIAKLGELRCIDVVAERFDMQHVKSFAASLAHLAPITVWSVLQALSRAFAAMAPEADRTSLHRVLKRLEARAKYTRRERPMPTPVELVALGRQMMVEADARDLKVESAVLYRTGLAIMAAALVPLRRATWAKARIGRNILLRGNRAWVRFEPTELKATNLPFQAELPADLASALIRYVQVYRPTLRGAHHDSGALWLAAWSGDQMHVRGFASAVSGAVRSRLGVRFSFHNFRHSAATFVVENAPDQSLLAATVLHHADVRTTLGHYVRGQRMAAARTYHTIIKREVAKAQRGCHSSRPRR